MPLALAARWAWMHFRMAIIAWWQRDVGRFGLTRRQTSHDVVDLVGIYGFPLQQGRGHDFDLVTIIFQQLARNAILRIDNTADFSIYFLHGGFRHTFVRSHRAPKEPVSYTH